MTRELKCRAFCYTGLPPMDKLHPVLLADEVFGASHTSKWHRSRGVRASVRTTRTRLCNPGSIGVPP
jgi:hypothetical protein